MHGRSQDRQMERPTEDFAVNPFQFLKSLHSVKIC